MDSRLYRNLETPNILARDWVIKQWKIHGIWAYTWSVTGPGDQEKWECGPPEGIPDCLFYMELVWEIQHIMLIQKPVLLPCLAAAQTRLPAVIPPRPWKPRDLGEKALSQLLERWEDKGFSSSTIQQSTLGYRRDLGELREWLPRPARDTLDSLHVTSWHDLLRGWRERIGTYASDLLGFALPPESQEKANAAVRAAQAESLRLDTLRRISPLQAPVTRTARAAGMESPGGEEMSELSGPQSREAAMSGVFGHPFDSRAISTEAAQEAVPRRVTHRSPRGARRNATGPSRARSVRAEETTRRRAANWAEVEDATESSENIASRRRSRRLQGDDDAHGAKRRRFA